MIFSGDFIDLQVRFARRAREINGGTLERALLDCTNLYVRVGAGRRFEASNPRWRACMEGLERGASPEGWLRRCYLDGAEANTAPPVMRTVGCFSWALEGDRAVRLHFRNVEPPGRSPLARAQLGARRAELGAIFAEVGQRVGPLGTIHGVSWLYNLEAYRRLFPPIYGASRREVRGKLRSMGLWGQFLTHQGALKASAVEPFEASVAQADTMEALVGCFPFQAQAVEAPLAPFLDGGWWAARG